MLKIVFRVALIFVMCIHKFIYFSESTSIKCESYNIRIGESTTLVNNNTILPEDVLLNGNRCRKYKYINPELYDKKYEEQSSCTKSENYILLIGNVLLLSVTVLINVQRGHFVFFKFNFLLKF